jgi:hypothetical protein
VADADSKRQPPAGDASHNRSPDEAWQTNRTGSDGQVEHTDSTQREGNKCAKREQPTHSNTCGPSWWRAEPDVGRVANGVAARVDRLKAIGNGQVAAVAATAWRLLDDLP